MSQVYAILGTDEGKVSEEALKLYNSLNPADADEFANDLIEGQADNVEHALEICSNTISALQTLPFFGGSKIVWLKNASFLGDDRTGGSERVKESVEALQKVLSSGLGDDVIFLLSASSIDKRRAFFKYLKKETELKVFDKIDVSKDGWEDQVAQLTEKQANEKGFQFDSEALELFVQQVGEDTRQISNELEKLKLYLRSRESVTVEDVRLMIPLNRKGIIWEVSRCVERREGQRAIQLINQQMEKGESAVSLLRAAIIPTIRNLFFAKLAMEEGRLQIHNYKSFQSGLSGLSKSARAALPKKADGTVSAWGLFLAARVVGEMNLDSLTRSLEACLKADRALVTSSADHHMVLHRLVIEVSL